MQQNAGKYILEWRNMTLEPTGILKESVSASYVSTSLLLHVSDASDDSETGWLACTGLHREGHVF